MGRFRPLGAALSLLVHFGVLLPLVWLASASTPETPPRLLTLHMVSRGNSGLNSEEGALTTANTANAGVEAAHTAPPANTAPAPVADNPTHTPAPSARPGAVSTKKRPAHNSSAVHKPATVHERSKDENQRSPVGDSGSHAETSTANGTQAARGGTDDGLAGGSEPVLTQFTRPPYPRRSRQAGEEGRVVVEAHVSAHGTLIQAVVLHSSGHVRLDEAARNSLSKARFQPATRQGRPVEGRLRVPFVFSLNQGEDA